MHARDTRRVYKELLGTAERSVWVSTYAFFDGPQAFRTLAARMDVIPGLEVTLLLNIDRRRMDTTAAESLVRRFADEFWHKEWPGAVRPKVYYDPRSVEMNGPRRGAPCQGGGGGRGIGIRYVREPDRSCVGPQYRARASGAGSRTCRDNGDSLSNADRERPASTIAGLVATDIVSAVHRCRWTIFQQVVYESTSVKR